MVVSPVSQPSAVVISGVLAVGFASLWIPLRPGQAGENSSTYKKRHIVNSRIVFNSRMIPLEFDPYACSPFLSISRGKASRQGSSDLLSMIRQTAHISLTGYRRTNPAFASCA